MYVNIHTTFALFSQIIYVCVWVCMYIWVCVYFYMFVYWPVWGQRCTISNSTHLLFFFFFFMWWEFYQQILMRLFLTFFYEIFFFFWAVLHTKIQRLRFWKEKFLKFQLKKTVSSTTWISMPIFHMLINLFTHLRLHRKFSNCAWS